MSSVEIRKILDGKLEDVEERRYWERKLEEVERKEKNAADNQRYFVEMRAYDR